MDNLGKRSRESVYWGLLLKLIHQLFHLGISIYVARVLGPRDIGAMAIAMAIIIYANNLTSFGMTSAIVQSKELEDDTVNSVFSVNLILSVLLILLINLGSNRLSVITHVNALEDILFPLSLIIIISSFFNIPLALLRRGMNFKLHSWIEFVQGLVTSILMLVLVVAGLKIWALVMSQIIGYVAAVIVIMISGVWVPKFKLSMKRLKRLSEYSLYDLLRYHISYIHDYLSYWIISISFNPTMLGIYDRAYSISSLPNKKLQVQMDAVLFTAFSRIQDDPARIKQAIKKSLLGSSLIVTPLFVVLIMLSPLFVEIFLGREWTQMIYPLQILSAMGIMRFYNGVMYDVNISTGSYKIQTFWQITIVGLFIFLLAICAKWGLIGIAYASLITSIVTLMINTKIVVDRMKIPWNQLFGCMIPSVSGSAAVLIAYCLAKLYFNESNFINFIILVAICMFTYIAWFVVIRFNMVNDLIKEVLLDFRSKNIIIPNKLARLFIE